jgi:predicted unusual protein kinase regulating ubiquinone biosynthesis (AarF/ABC1/UbiB family)
MSRTIDQEYYKDFCEKLLNTDPNDTETLAKLIGIKPKTPQEDSTLEEITEQVAEEHIRQQFIKHQDDEPKDTTETKQQELSPQMDAYVKVCAVLTDICEQRNFDFNASYNCTNYLDMRVLHVLEKCNSHGVAINGREIDKLIIAFSEFLDNLDADLTYEIPGSGTYELIINYYLIRILIETVKNRTMIRLVFLFFVFYLFVRATRWVLHL